jgi:pyruvate/2-oxoglutarate dehydrogenase complex dihydrolipoamide acyltransferase (E2) component
MGIEEGTIVAWLKAEGDAVVQGDVIAEVETAKATIEVEAPISGILVRIAEPEGATVEVNVPIGEIESA